MSHSAAHYTGLVVLKLGGELVDGTDAIDRIGAMIAHAAARQPVVVVHGGGREIDTELASAGLDKQAVDGLRITDAATLDVVVGVLAGRVNTRLVAAVTRAGASAVGLTGADDRIGLCRLAPSYRATDGRLVDLGLVGQPIASEAPRLLDHLRRAGYTPIVACIGMTDDGQLLNVNADTLAAQLAVNIQAGRLIIAGATGAFSTMRDGRSRRSTTAPSTPWCGPAAPARAWWRSSRPVAWPAGAASPASSSPMAGRAPTSTS